MIVPLETSYWCNRCETSKKADIHRHVLAARNACTHAQYTNVYNVSQYSVSHICSVKGHLGLVMLGQDYSGQESAFLVDLRRLEIGLRVYPVDA